MTTNEKERIREQARKLLRKVWEFRDEWLSPNLSEIQVLRAAPDVIVTQLLKYDLKKVPEILCDAEGFETAGIVDRELRRIEISQQPKFETWRYTLAHEIAHVVLHKGQTLHRDRPSDGSGSPDYRKPQIEQEADIFAAELLMPEKLLTRVFVECFDGRIDRCDIDENFAFRLCVPLGRLTRMSAADLAHYVAGVNGFGSNFFEPLDKRFGVSRSAMAIQLTDHRLIV